MIYEQNCYNLNVNLIEINIKFFQKKFSKKIKKKFSKKKKFRFFSCFKTL